MGDQFGRVEVAPRDSSGIPVNNTVSEMTEDAKKFLGQNESSLSLLDLCAHELNGRFNDIDQNKDEFIDLGEIMVYAESRPEDSRVLALKQAVVPNYNWIRGLYDNDVRRRYGTDTLDTQGLSRDDLAAACNIANNRYNGGQDTPLWTFVGGVFGGIGGFVGGIKLADAMFEYGWGLPVAGAVIGAVGVGTASYFLSESAARAGFIDRAAQARGLKFDSLAPYYLSDTAARSIKSHSFLK